VAFTGGSSRAGVGSDQATEYGFHLDLESVQQGKGVCFTYLLPLAGRLAIDVCFDGKQPAYLLQKTLCGG